MGTPNFIAQLRLWWQCKTCVHFIFVILFTLPFSNLRCYFYTSLTQQSHPRSINYNFVKKLKSLFAIFLSILYTSIAASCILWWCWLKWLFFMTRDERQLLKSVGPKIYGQYQCDFHSSQHGYFAGADIIWIQTAATLHCDMEDVMWRPLDANSS